MSLHATEVADHLGHDLIRYRRRRFWRPGLGDWPISLRARRTRRSTRLAPAAVPVILLLTLCVLYCTLSRRRQEGPPSQAAVAPRRHRLRKPEDPQVKAPVLEALPILPISGAPIDAEDYAPVAKENVTVLLPVDIGSYMHLPSLLAPFFIITHRPGEIIVAAPYSLLDEVKSVVQATLLTLRDANVPLQVLAWQEELSAREGCLHVAARSTKQYVLLLDEKGSHDIDSETLMSLLTPNALPWPVGPRGVSFSPTNVSCTAHTSGEYWPVAFLLPPFIVPTSLLRDVEVAIRMNDFRIWFSLGERVTRLTGATFGGLSRSPSIAPANLAPPDWCRIAEQHVLDPGTGGLPNPRQSVFQRYRSFETRRARGSTDLPIRIVVATLEDLLAFAFTICRMASRGSSLRIYVLEGPPHATGTTRSISAGGCHMHYDGSDGSTPTIDQLQRWLSHYCQATSIVLHTLSQEIDTLLLGLMRIYAATSASSMIWLPQEDLSTSGWMAELTSEELQSWQLPHVELSVITNNRPASLQRLLTSLQKASYYGDLPLLTISLEETADSETLRIAQNFDWPLAGAQLRHRVVHGGLLPAVVEAWYPYSNDSYGLLLEDDVEVSPMFYAWIKFAILRYRYGEGREDTSRLFGVSLYQAKHVELRPEGRRPFQAQALFANSSIRYPHTPYLSQVPCSWGAVFFPEHWREFHAYLSLRLSDRGRALPIDIVPDIRSNKWSKSWKRYFIEMSYLRGYVMLYPNYDHFVSLSTNHLELGEHRHEIPDRILTKKKAQFQVPLMGVDTSDYGVNVLDLPQGTLPAWRDLPVVDLLGNIASLELLKWRGAYRHEEVTECTRLLTLAEPSTHDATELLCFYDDDQEDD
ncbi:hypothetical protein CALVIDRAFT_492262, partial [Calocera viscosa TUFC12733]